MSKNIFKWRYLMLLLFPAVFAKADCLDIITPELQPESKICWAVCADMMLQYYGNPPNLHGIWDRGTHGINIINGLCGYPDPGDYQNIRDILESGNPVRNVPLQQNECHSGVELWDDLQADICGAKPVIAGLVDGGTWGHVVLVVGWDSDGWIQFNDPEKGTQRELPYDDFCDNSGFYWDTTLVPDEGSPVGQVPVEPSISITSGSTQFVYPGSNATYTSLFYCPSGQTCMPPSQWNWSLQFFHNGGNYTVASGTVSGSGWGSTWNVSAFTLPTSGYEWQYDADGLVMGMVTVSISGYSAWKSVTYEPQNPIPGYVDFNNQTVSGSHADVTAHYCIGINDVTINSNATITFEAGQCFTIDDLTVQNGSDVTIRVDPTLQ